MTFCVVLPVGDCSCWCKGKSWTSLLGLLFNHSLESPKDQGLLLLPECVESGGSDWVKCCIQITGFQNMSLGGKYTNVNFCFCNKF